MTDRDGNFSSLGQLLSRHETNTLLARARLLAELHRSLQTVLPPELQPHCRLANVRDGVVIMLATSSIWASRLRFHQTDLLKHLNEVHGLLIYTLRIKVSTNEVDSRRP